MNDASPTFRPRESSPISSRSGLRMLTREDPVQIPSTGATVRDSRCRADNIYHRFTKNVRMYTDDPEHAKLRAATRAGFTRTAHDHYDKIINEVAAELVARVSSGGATIDAVAELTEVLPVEVAVEAFGAPREDLGTVLPQVKSIMTFWSGPQDQPVPLSTLLDDLDVLHTYAVELVQGKRGRVLPDTVIARLAADLPGDVPGYTVQQAVQQLVLLLIALFAPTTPGSLSSATLAFAHSPEQVRRIVTDPACLDNVANEVVRLNGSNQFTWRVAEVPVVIGDVDIAAGEGVAVFVGAANRDPAVFDHPDDFDLARANSIQHMSSGRGRTRVWTARSRPRDQMVLRCPFRAVRDDRVGRGTAVERQSRVPVTAGTAGHSRLIPLHPSAVPARPLR